MTPFNVLIHEKRVEKGLSVKEAAKKLRLPPVLLKRYEYGYYSCSRKLVAKMCALYDIDERTLFYSTAAYYGDIADGDEKKKNVKPFNIVALVFLVIFTALTTVSGVFYRLAKTDPVYFYSDEYNAFVDAVFKKIDEEFSFTDEDAPLTTSDLATNDENDDEKTLFGDPNGEIVSDEGGESFFDEDSDIPIFNGGPLSDLLWELLLKFTLNRSSLVSETTCGSTKFTVGFDERTTISVDSSFTANEENGSTSIIFSQMMKKSLSLTIEDADSVFYYYALVSPEKGLNLSLYETDEEYTAEEIAFAQSKLDDAINAFNETIKVSLGIDYSFDKLIFDQYDGFSHYANSFTAWFFLVLLSPVVLLFILYFLLKINVLDKMADKFIVKETLPTEKGADLPLKCGYTPIFNERIIKILGLILLLLSSSVAFVNYVYSHKLVDFVSSLTNLPSFTAVLKGALPVAVSLLFFVKIDISIRKRNMPQTTLMFFLLGLGYFYAVFLVAYTLNIKQFVPLLNMIRNYLPGNVFMGMAAIASVALFLFCTPRFCLKRKANVVFWRLLAVIPAFYLIFSNFVAPFIDVPVYVNAFLYPKSLMPTLFCILYIAGMYVFNNAVIKKYKANAAAFVCGKRYFLAKNILTASLIAVLSVSDYLLGLVPALNALGFGKSYIMAAMIPFILFYQPRIEKRNPVEDACYGICYGLCFCCSYVAFIAYYLTVYKELFRLILQIYVFLMNIFG